MKRIPLSSMPTAYRSAVLGLLAASPFARPSRMRNAIVVTTPERREVLHRLAFAAELRSGGLEAEAKEIADEVLRAGEVMAYALRDDADGAGVAAAVLTMSGRR